MRNDGLAQARLVALLVPLGLMAGALGSQYIGKLVPCEMCMWQRWPHYTAIVLAALAFLVPGRGPKVALVALAALLIGTSGVIGVMHAGVEYHWWPGFTPCSTQADAGASGMDYLNNLQRKPPISCDVPQWSLFGISLAGFNAIFSFAGALAVFGLLIFRRAR